MKQNSLLSIDPTELFLRFQQGDASAFKLLYQQHFPRIFRIIQHYVDQRDVVEDIVSNAFVKLYERRAAMRESDHIYSFLFVVARNEAIGYLRTQRRLRVARAVQERTVDREYLDPRDAEAEWERWTTKIRELMELLPPARRQIFRLHFVEGLSIREIAIQLDLTERTVRNQRNRALIFLRQSFPL